MAEPMRSKQATANGAGKESARWRLRDGWKAMVVGWVFAVGCGGDEQATSPLTASPEDAKATASQLERVFEEAPPEIRQNATIAQSAIATSDYEKAVASVLVMERTRGLTREQGLAVMNSRLMLESQLVEAMERGDPQAKRAFEMLRSSSGKR